MRMRCVEASHGHPHPHATLRSTAPVANVRYSAAHCTVSRRPQSRTRHAVHSRMPPTARRALISAFAAVVITPMAVARDQAVQACSTAGFSAAPAQTIVVRDQANANTAFVVDSSCNTTTVTRSDTTTPTTLNLAGFDIETIVSYPVATVVDLSDNLVTRADFSKDTTMERLLLKRNALDNFEGFFFPPQLVDLDLSLNPLRSLTELRLPSSLHNLDLSSCELKSVRGVRLPPALETLDLRRNKLTEIEVRSSDVSVLQHLTKALPSLTNASCSYPNATIVRVGNSTSVCVISDTAFDELYGMPKTPPPMTVESPAPSSTNNHQLIIIGLVIAGVLLVVVLFIGYRLSRRFEVSTLSGGGQRGRRRYDKSSSGGVLVSSDTGDRPLGFPMDYYEDDDVRFDEELAQYKIQKSDIQKKKVLARGGFGVVYLAKYRGMTVAVKQLQRDRMRYHTLQHFMQEIRLLAGLNNPYIVGFLGVSWTTLHNIAIVMEHLPRGDLFTLLRQQKKKIKAKKSDANDFKWFRNTSPTRSPTPVKAKIAMNIAAAMVYLHSQEKPIIHRDLKSKNVLLSDDFTAKVSDFGISRLQTMEETMTREVGTVAWIAPEVLTGSRYTEKADIYSFGVLLTELDTCHPPYTIGLGPDAPKRTNTWIASQVSTGALKPALLLSCPEGVRDLALKCMSFQPADRPSAVEILHRFQGMLTTA